jgi:hypothetical protein
VKDATHIPLPAPPATQYFDLSESSPGSSSSSRGSGVIRHRAGQEQILVGFNEPFMGPFLLVTPFNAPEKSGQGPSIATPGSPSTRPAAIQCLPAALSHFRCPLAQQLHSIYTWRQGVINRKQREVIEEALFSYRNLERSDYEQRELTKQTGMN